MLFKENFAHLTRGLALSTLIFTSIKRMKSLFVHANYARQHYVRTLHVPNKFNNAIVIPTLMGEYATHRNCSQYFQKRLQCNIGSCRGGEIRDGQS